MAASAPSRAVLGSVAPTITLAASSALPVSDTVKPVSSTVASTSSMSTAAFFSLTSEVGSSSESLVRMVVSPYSGPKNCEMSEV